MVKITTLLLIPLTLLLAACDTPQSQTPPEPASTPPATTSSDTQAQAPLGPLAPEFQGRSLSWLNTTSPITLEALRGQVVVVDFWTYCCVNCLHILPELAALERRHADDPVVVLGVHSGKFEAEKDPQRIAEAIARYDIHHPVLVDSEFEVWQAWNAQAWPTVYVLDAGGHVVAGISGEPPAGWLEAQVQRALEQSRAHGTLAEAPYPITRPERDTTPLRFPGKVLAAPDGRLFIADTGHHRVVITDADGAVQDIIGSGLVGAFDGPFEAASFYGPQGLALRGDALYIADTTNHLIRRADLTTRTVTTIAGTGAKGDHTEAGGADRDPQSVALRSPWDVELAAGDQLIIAMAGNHQLWRYDLEQNTIARWSGTGREFIDDGAADVSSFSQPSGLAILGETLYVADAETSAIRAVSLDSGAVETVIGKGLFDFGDVDGVGDTVRLQHVLDVERVGAHILIADAYNNAIKRLAPETRTVTTLARGELSEPSGLSARGDMLYIADTNNHRIRALDVRTNSLADVPVSGLSAPSLAGVAAPATDAVRPGAGLTFEGVGSGDAVRVSATGGVAGEGVLRVTPALPPGYAMTEGSPWSLKLDVSGAAGVTSASPERAGSFRGESTPFEVPVTISGEASGTVKLAITFYYCATRDTKRCFVERARLEVDGESLRGGGSVVEVAWTPSVSPR